MSAQILYGLKQAAIMAALAFLGYIIANQDMFFGHLDNTAKLLVVGILPLFVRVFEGWRDGVRASEGKIQDADVAAAAATEYKNQHPYADDPHLAVNKSLANANKIDPGYPHYSLADEDYY